MTDTLRTRIAAAVWMRHRAEAFAQCGLDALAVPEHPIPNWAYGMADAVIEELGLREEKYELLSRYVTKWKMIKDAEKP